MKLPTGESVFDPQSVFFMFRKNLSMAALNARLRKRFGEALDSRDPNRLIIPLRDALTCAFAMFSLKIPSLLAFDGLRRSNSCRENLKSLFGVESIPSDTSMREILDEVDPEHLRPAFKDVFSELQRGKALESYQFMNDKYPAIPGQHFFDDLTRVSGHAKKIFS